MKRSTLTFSAGAMAALVALAACSSDSTSSNGSPSNSEIQSNSRQAAVDAAAATLSQLGGAEADVGAGDVAGAVVGETTVNCNGSPDADGWFTCTAALDNGVTVERQVRFWSGTNYDLGWNYPSPTDSMNTIWTANGTLTGTQDPAPVITVADSDHATLTVIRPPSIRERHSWTGAGAAHHVATWVGPNAVERILTQTGADSVNAVLFQMPRSSNPYPLSGSITLNFMAHLTAGNDSRTETQRFVITFNGTNTASLQDGGITCDLLLDPPHTISNCH